MGDVKPNPVLEIARVEMQIQNQKSTVARQRFELVEMEDRMSRNNENITSALGHIKDLEQTLSELTKGNADG